MFFVLSNSSLVGIYLEVVREDCGIDLHIFHRITMFAHWIISLHGRNDILLASTAHVLFLIDLSLRGINMAVRVYCCPPEI